MLKLLSDRGAFGRPNKYRSAVNAGLIYSYNDENSKLYLNGSLSDSAAGNTSPITVTNNGVTLDGNNNLGFGTGEGDYLFIDKAAINAVFAAGNEWHIDLWIYPTGATTSAKCLFAGNDVAVHSDLFGAALENERINVFYASWIANGTQLSSTGSIVLNTWQHIRFEKWLDGAQWKFTTYIDGVAQTTINVSDTALYTTNDFTIGYTGTTSRRFEGNMNKIMVKNIAATKGVTFTPPSRT